MTYRVGVIGAAGRGDYGHQIDLAFQNVEGAVVVAVADRDTLAAERSRERTGAGRIYGDYCEMLDKERPDIVAICPRWTDERAPMVLAAVEAGVKGILCEKPIASTLAHADRIVAACERAGVRMAVAHRRASGYEIYAKQLVDAGAIGRIKMLRGYGKGDHRAGAEDFSVLGPHILDSMRHFAGSDVAWAFGHVTTGGREAAPNDARPGAEGIGRLAGDAIFAYYTFLNGVTATFESHAVDRPGPRRFGFDIYGETGIIALRDSPRGEMYVYGSGTWMPGPEDGRWEQVRLPAWDNRPDGSKRTGRDWTHASNRLIAEEIVDALREDRPLRGVATAQDARAALEMVHAVHLSHLVGQRVAFPLNVRDNPYEAVLGKV